MKVLLLLLSLQCFILLIKSITIMPPYYYLHHNKDNSIIIGQSYYKKYWLTKYMSSVINNMYYKASGSFKKFYSYLATSKGYNIINDRISIMRKPRIDSSCIWCGERASVKEWQAILEIKQMIRDNRSIGFRSKWLENGVTNIELLRFLRSKGGDVNATWEMLLNSAKWRKTKNGADNANAAAREFSNSLLHKEMFWLGPNRKGIPTLVIRTQIHDGVFYNEDPRVFARFVMHLLEVGRQRYGVGTKVQMSLLLDRGGVVMRNGETNHEKTDRGVLPRLVSLVNYTFRMLKENYPDIMDTATVVPTSWFFVLCWKFTNRALDPKTRSKFEMVRPKHTKARMSALFPTRILPHHLGGTNSQYESTVVLRYPTH